jgi:MFS transporter, NNP family, nitrate/nitrite transporter
LPTVKLPEGVRRGRQVAGPTGSGRRSLPPILAVGDPGNRDAGSSVRIAFKEQLDESEDIGAERRSRRRPGCLAPTADVQSSARSLAPTGTIAFLAMAAALGAASGATFALAELSS